jgi:hypothetical protein
LLISRVSNRCRNNDAAQKSELERKRILKKFFASDSKIEAELRV